MSDGGQCILSPFYLHPIFLVKDDVTVILLLGVSSWTQSSSASLGSRDLGAEKFTLIFCRLLCVTGGYKEMSSILADQPSYMSPNAEGWGGGGWRGLSRSAAQCAQGTWSPNKLSCAKSTVYPCHLHSLLRYLCLYPNHQHSLYLYSSHASTLPCAIHCYILYMDDMTYAKAPCLTANMNTFTYVSFFLRTLF